MHKQSSLLTVTLILALIFGTMHLIATKFYLYWSVWWIDNVLHFTGGTLLATLAMWLVYYSRKRTASKARSFVVTFVAVMVIGVAWEIFEYKLGLTQSTEKYSLDVAHDLLSDAIGACVGWLIASSRRFKNG